MFRALHVADVHLGKKFRKLGEKGRQQRQQIRETFSNVIDAALSEDIQIVLFAGDIFDRDEVFEGDFLFFLSLVKKLSDAGIYSCIIAGNHDMLHDDSPYARKELLEIDRVIVFTKDQYYFEIPDLDAVVYGASCYSKKSTESPFSVFKEKKEAAHQIGIIHGSFVIPEKSSPDAYPFTSEEIAASGFDYVAIGDWHSYQDYSVGDVKAFYSGAPEALDFDQRGAGFVNIVTFEHGAVVEKVRVGKREFKKVEVDVTGIEDVFSHVLKKVLDVSGVDVICELRLSGMLSLDQMFSREKLLEECGDSFFELIFYDETEVELSEDALADFDEDTVVGVFVNRMKQKIEQSAGEHDRKVLEKALQFGVSKLMGK